MESAVPPAHAGATPPAGMRILDLCRVVSGPFAHVVPALGYGLAVLDRQTAH